MLRSVGCAGRTARAGPQAPTCTRCLNRQFDKAVDGRHQPGMGNAGSLLAREPERRAKHGVQAACGGRPRSVLLAHSSEPAQISTVTVSIIHPLAGREGWYRGRPHRARDVFSYTA